MDPIFEKFSQLWSKSLLDPNDKSAAATVNSQFFHKARLDSGLYQDMLDLLKDEFYNCKHNVFETHLYLIEKSLNEKGIEFKFARAAFINQAFSDFYNQLKNLSKRNSKEQPANKHFSKFCKENEVCYCLRDHTTVLKAFEIAVNKNISMLSSFNKIYSFNDHLTHLMPTVEVFMKKNNFIEQATLVGELQLQEMFPLDNIVIPLMLIDKYPSIDDYINRNEKVLLKVVDLVDRLCSPDFNLRELANSYEYVQKKKVDKFKPKILAKYGSGCLKRCQKFHLIASDYKNIEIQLKITQMRFLVNLKYDKWGGDPISFEAWQELIMDLIGEHEILQTKLLFELIQYQKDIETAHKFLHEFGYDKSLSKLPESMKEFYAKNIELITNEKNREASATRSRSAEKKYYYPHQQLNEANIKFVGCTEDFVGMLDYFESSKPSVIGLDCEWKPSFEQSDTSNKNDKKNHASTLQVSTRDNAFIIDIKFLMDKLSPEVLERFGNLVLFDDNLLKLGYSFQQDAKKMSLSFPMFVHKFNEFEEDVVNIDEVVTEFQKNWNLFPNLDTEDQSAGKKSRSAKGLSGLTKKCFGAPLDKSECLSNWDNRPLRSAQLKYAALDAFVLIQIHDFIQARTKELGVSFSYSSKKNYF